MRIQRRIFLWCTNVLKMRVRGWMRKQHVKFISSFLLRLMKKGKTMELGFSIFQNTN